jgi:hypothetical protein
LNYRVEHNNGTNWVHQYTVKGDAKGIMTPNYIISLERPISYFIEEDTDWIYYTTIAGDFRLIPTNID